MRPHEILPASIFDLPIKDELNLQQVQQLLAAEISHLIRYDFEKLKNIMYRIDIDENKFYSLLGEPNAGQEIAKLIIERQIEKAISRRNNP